MNEGDALRLAAADWFARLRGPDGAASRDAFEDWRRADPAHAAAYARLEQHWADAALLGATEVGRARTLTRAVPPLQRRSVQLAIAAAIVGLVGVTSWPLAVERFGGNARAVEIEAPGSTLRDAVLADGSRVTLDRAARLRVAFNGRFRRIELLNGRARFDVAHDGARPFVVHAGTAQITARGTLFDVAFAEPGVTVTLWRGAVDVGGEEQRPTRLRAGQRVQVGRRGQATAVVPAPAGAGGWAAPMLDFDDAALGAIVEASNRSNTVAIRLADASLSALRVTGAYRMSDPAGLARSLAETLDLNLSREAGDYVLRSKDHTR